MAAEVPAKDVLCEAMEYLSKLGSNLRTRSENLRDKKIRRDKLNNVLAVQKAASKVLLICELSKKSLENVETGVRKVLNIIDASQSSSRDGGKTSKLENQDAEEKSKYYFIEYKSRKLRIKKRITLKHYTSVRVLAKSMPKSMIDKYPVHYDCKLYRMRKREKRNQKQNSECSNENEVQVDSACAQGVGDLGICEKEQGNNDMSIISIPDSPTKKSSVDKNVDETVRGENQDNSISIITIPDTPKSNSDGIDKKIGESDNKKRRRSGEKSKERSQSRDSDQSEKIKQSKEIEEKKDSSEGDLELQDSKEQDKYRTQKRSKSSDASKVKHRKTSEASTKSEKREKEKKKIKKVRVIEDSSDDDKKADEENIDISLSKKNESDLSCHEPEPKKLKLSFFTTTQNKTTNDEVILDLSDDEKHDDKKQNNDTENDSKIKPLIKCVSLSKLLKPDVLVKENIKKPHSKPKSSLIMKNKENESENNKSAEKLARKVREEEEYWIQKRKEVSSFKSKNFVINVIRLPEFSIEYLNKLSLKKITKSGVTICEIIDKNADAELKDDHETATSKNKECNGKKTNSDEDNDDNELIAEVSIIKDSLLNGSDSDGDALEEDKQKSAKNDSDTVKNALLKDSDSENKNSGEESQSICKNKQSEASISVTEVQNAKNALCNNSDSESDKNEIEPAAADNKKVNNAHLNNSDSENKAESDTAKSNAEEPEKMLLNHSDSESENLTATLVMEPDSEIECGTAETVAATSKSDRSHNEKDESNEKEKDPDNVLRQETDGSLSESHKNEKTPEKESSPGLGDDKTKTPLSQRMTPQSRKKRMREQIHAKKMLMTYSSSSDTEDEQLKEALKEIKNSLLHGSDEENSSKKQEKKQSRDSSPSSSVEDIIKKVKKKITYDSDTAKEKRVKHKRKKHRRRHDSEESTKNGNSDNSKSSSSKMVRSKSKPGNSSSQNSDAQDSNDKDIDGLTNMNTLNKTKTRRRRSDSADKTDQSSGSNTRSRRSKIKPTGLISEEVLKAESSSDLSASDEDKLDDEDDGLPPVTIPSFNGGVEHLVKEDLLGATDSSLSHDEAADKDDSDDEDKLNARRRKANAMISSDSEVGSSRKKDKDVKLSDFEDSDDSELTKRSKRKKKTVDSDASVGTASSNEGG